MECKSIMTTDVDVIQPRQTVAEAARRMRSDNVGLLPVVDKDRNIVGVITDRDITLRVVADDLDNSTLVEDAMSVDVICCRPEDDIRAAEHLMRVNQIWRIPCVDEAGHLAGIISLTDIVQYENPMQAAVTVGDVTQREIHGP